jgi:hypothetical protein
MTYLDDYTARLLDESGFRPLDGDDFDPDNPYDDDAPALSFATRVTAFRVA